MWSYLCLPSIFGKHYLKILQHNADLINKTQSQNLKLMAACLYNVVYSLKSSYYYFATCIKWKKKCNKQQSFYLVYIHHLFGDSHRFFSDFDWNKWISKMQINNERTYVHVEKRNARIEGFWTELFCHTVFRLVYNTTEYIMYIYCGLLREQEQELDLHCTRE